MDTPIGLQVRAGRIELPEPIDQFGPLAKIAQFQHAQTEGALGQLKLQQATEQRGALSEYGKTGDMETLRAHPDLYAKALGIQGTKVEQERATHADNQSRNARDAQYVDGFDEGSPARMAAWDERLETARREGRIPPLVYQQLRQRGPDKRMLQAIIQQGASIETPAKMMLEEEQLTNRSRALGLTPPDAPASSSGRASPTQSWASPDVTGTYPGTYPRFDAASAQPPAQRPNTAAAPAAAKTADPYLQLTEPAIAKSAEEAERKRRAAQAAAIGDIKGAAKIMNKEDDPKEYQTKDASFAERMARSEISLRGVLGVDNKNYDPGKRINKFLPNWNITNSSEWQQYEASAREWIAAKLRKDTGAAVTQTEWDLYFPTYFPQPGDDPKTQAAKLDRRIQDARGMRGSSGPAFDRMYPNFDTDMRERLRVQDPDKYKIDRGPLPQSAPPEGATAINKATKQRLIMKDGKWQPIQ